MKLLATKLKTVLSAAIIMLGVSSCTELETLGDQAYNLTGGSNIADGKHVHRSHPSGIRYEDPNNVFGQGQDLNQPILDTQVYIDEQGRRVVRQATETLQPLVHGGNNPRIGVLLPLTGRASKTGKMLLDAAKLAVTDLDGDNIDLMAFDTKSSQAGATKAARDAIANGAQLILGPLYSNAVTSVKPITQSAGVNMISFSNNAEVAGQGAYLLGVMPDAQIRSIIEYASDKGISTISAILPDDKFGQIAKQVIEDMSYTGQIEIGAIEVYQAQHPIFGTTVKKFRRQIREAGITPNKDDHALLFIESGARLKKTLNAMDLYGLPVGKKFTLLGSYLWNNPETLSIADASGAYFVDVPGESREEFNIKFDSQFGYPPSNIASLGYDAVALAIALARQGRFDYGAITNPSGFIGNNGYFKILPSGTSTRDLEISKVSGGNAERVRSVSAQESSSYYSRYFEDSSNSYSQNSQNSPDVSYSRVRRKWR